MSKQEVTQELTEEMLESAWNEDNPHISFKAWLIEGINAAKQINDELRATIAEQAAQLEQFQFLLVANNAVDAKDLGGVIDALYRRITELEKNTAQEVKSCHSTP